MKYRVAVLGSGSWGTALAQVLAENGHDVRLWGHREEQANEINQQHTNHRYLPDLKWRRRSMRSQTWKKQLLMLMLSYLLFQPKQSAR